MKVMNYSDVRKEKKYLHFLNQTMGITKKLTPVFDEKYYFGGIYPHANVCMEMSLIGNLPYILAMFDGNIEGKVILDLGCGSNNSRDGIVDSFEPWLCRALYELGASPIGIDLYISGEEFESHSLNLLDNPSFDFLEDDSVDMVNACKFFDSPALLKELKYGNSTLYKFRLLLETGLERVVKPEGYFIFEK